MRIIVSSVFWVSWWSRLGTKQQRYSKEVVTSSITSGVLCNQEGRIDRFFNNTGLWFKMKHITQGVELSILGPKGNIQVNQNRQVKTADAIDALDGSTVSENQSAKLGRKPVVWCVFFPPSFFTFSLQKSPFLLRLKSWVKSPLSENRWDYIRMQCSKRIRVQGTKMYYTHSI